MTDIEIANKCKMVNINEIGSKIGLNPNDLVLYGQYKAKINKEPIECLGKLILVTAINPTPFGEGKTTVSIGLGDALCKLNKKSLIVLREPSLGPVFGMKGGATGGGYSQIVPMDDINLHFNGDFHAITAANNLLSAAIDNHIYFGNTLDIQEICFDRCLDINDRALRHVELANRIESFNITAASEIMAIFCLANDIFDLKRRLGNIVIGYNSKREMIFAKDLKVEGAMTVLLKDAILPNLVQTLENNPVIVHGGPFANIAHGCNSIIATKLGLSLSDYVVTEAGFGADLGALKFFDIKCRNTNIFPDCVVLVATIKALKYNGGIAKELIMEENVEAVKQGLCNLEAHIENLKQFGVNIVVCLNKYTSDTNLEIKEVLDYCTDINIPCEISTAYIDGGNGAINLAKKVIDVCNQKYLYHELYDKDLSIINKIEIITKKIYRAADIVYMDNVLDKIKELEAKGFGHLPICIAKTQYSLSDDPKKLGKPSNYTITVKDIKLYNGAEFITILLGTIMTMPGLPKIPNYEKIDIDEFKNVRGIF
ncbi:MAG: formate--tetrahydrofolate ligase [Bacilli bacterium]